MEKIFCSICSKKTSNQCGLCKAPTCKVCAHNIGDNYFSFLNEIPEDLRHGYYCNLCFVSKVSNDYESYNTILESAKKMDVYFKKKSSKQVRFFHPAAKTVSIKECVDYDEMILRLAFFAAKNNYNTIINVETSSHKTYSGSYKTILWSGTALPANKKQ